MGETSMISGSGTQGRSGGQEKKVDICSTGREPVATDHTSKHGNVYAVRVTKSEERVVVQVDTGRLIERSRIKAANDSIRRRTRG